ncbi:MAG: cbb3-type cytochrome c oxidase subunit I [Chthoniobacterales bacterium]|nr:cbb3-type cytochrome c oxidase subunit I [Chthoniobacterales bacterium]
MNQDSMLSQAQAMSNLYEPAPLHTVMRSEIDSSLRLPLLLLVRTSTFWLVMGSFLALLSAVKLVIPSFLDGISLFTYGRIFPVACDLLVYGWATPAGLAISLWFMARLCGTRLHYTKVLVSAALLWNAGIFLSSLALLCGYSTSVELLEYPAWGSFLLFIAFLLMGIWVILLFATRQPRSLYLSQWYFLTAICSFPWAYATANMLLVWGHIQGSAQGPIHFWYISNLFGLWITPLALGMAFYLIPKITGASINSYYLGIVGFFSLLLFAAWSGMTFLLGGPVPAWMVSASIVATTLLALPMAALLVNFFKMLQGKETMLVKSPVLRFTYVGILFFIISMVLVMIHAIPCFNAILHFTDYTAGLLVSLLIGFFGMTLFGALYYIMPRLTGVAWFSTQLILRHFWMITVGVGLMVFSSLLGGMVEGIALNDPVIAFINVLSYAAPWRWLMVIAWLLIFLGSISFIRLLILMRWQMIEESIPLVSCSTASNS